MPLVSQTFDQLLDFTRTTSGTFVGSNGLIQTTPASVNLFTQTQQFDNAAWTKSNATVTANIAVAPDGTSTADALVENTATGTHVTYQVFTFVAATTYTYSAYVKANGRTKFDFASLSGFSPGASFDLTAVTATPLGVTSAATITAVGNGWYRCTATRTSAGGSDQAQIRLVDAAGASTYTGDGTSGVFIWGAQLEAASAASTYTRNNGGVFPPRFDYDPVTLQPKGIQIEEQRTNLLVRSAEFDNAIWVAFGTKTVTANTATAPDGTLTADTLSSPAVNGVAQQNITITGSTAYTGSVYVKATTGTQVRLQLVSSGGTGASTDQLLTISSGSNMGNGWYRLAINITSAAADNQLQMRILTDASANPIYIWGAQLEAGSFATSYIPTVASQVTRTADQTSIVAPNFASWYNQSEGTFVATFDTSVLLASSLVTVYTILSANDQTSANSIDAFAYSNYVGATIRAGNVVQADINGGGSPTNNAIIKLASAYAANDVALSVNGATPVTDSSATIPTTNQFSIGMRTTGGTSPINGHIRSIRYYPVRLSNAQLQALTA